MRGLIALLIAVVGVSVLAWVMHTPGDQLAWAAVGGMLCGQAVNLFIQDVRGR